MTGVQFLGTEGTFVTDGVEFDAKTGTIHAYAPAGMPARQGIAVDLGNALAVTFDEVTQAGSTSVEIIPTKAALTGTDTLKVASQMYDVTSTSVHEGAITVTVPYRSEDFGDETDLRLLHFDGAGWDDVTIGVDTSAQTVTGLATSLSPFVVVGGAGVPPAPAPTCQGLPATIVGTEGDDVLVGTDGRDVIAGLAGDDAIDGLDGDDVIDGDDGVDLLRGGEGEDTLSGGKGDDVLWGGPGPNDLEGGAGNDRLDGEPN